MIVGLIREPMIERLQKFDWTFYLTGSRYFGTASDNSDWDFFCEEHSGVIEFLEELGFKRYSGQSYKSDSTISVVYRFASDYDSKYKGPTIDIQLIRPIWLDKKLKAQEKLKTSGVMTYADVVTNKSLARAIWNLALINT